MRIFLLMLGLTAILGALAGWFFALTPVCIITAFTVLVFLNQPYEMQDVTRDYDGGIAFVQITITVFLLALWTAFAVSSGWFAHVVPMVWPVIREFLFK